MNFPIISEEDVKNALSEKDALRLARETFELIAKKKVFMPPKIYLLLPASSDFRAMPAYLETGEGQGACGVKWIGVFPHNPAKKLPTVTGTVLLNSPETGRLLAVLEANTITAMRTAATSALASSVMANPSPKILSIVGAGIQAGYQLRAHADLYRLDEIRVWGYLPGEAERFCAAHPEYKNLRPFALIKDCVESADIIITCTSSREPLVRADWVKAGAHINAIGADAKGKQELEPELLLRARVVVDDWEQASHSGEINVPITEGMLTRSSIYAELSDIVSGAKPGRRTSQEITVFDSTGLAALDIHFSSFIYLRRNR